MPAPLSKDLRARIMALVNRGTSVSEISRRLLVARSTVNRLRKAASEQQHNPPIPKPMGGFRKARLNQDEKKALVSLALENRKRTAEDIRALAVEQKLIPADVSLSTIYRALWSRGLFHGRLPWKDPRVQTDPLIVDERKRFRRHQRSDPRFAPDKLMWFDESNYRLWEQAKRGWKRAGQPGQHLFRPKGTSPRVSVMVTVGAPDILHYQIHRPRREYPVIDPLYQASELSRPGKGVRTIPYTNRQIRRQLTCAELRAVLRQHGVKFTKANKPTLIERVLHLKTKGHLGLPRPGRQDVGGRLQPVINTAGDVWRYFHDELVPTLGQSIRGRAVVMDNASTHGAPPLTNPRAVSFLHVKAREDWALDGVIFLPPRSPSYSVVELVFAWTKRKLRKRAPDQGYTEDELVAAIHEVFGELREAVRQAREAGRPTFVENWLRKCGYRSNRDDDQVNNDNDDGRPRAGDDVDEGRPRAGDDNEDETDKGTSQEQQRPQRTERGRPQRLQRPARWPGYGPGEPSPEHRLVIRPPLNVAELGGDIYELEDIVDEQIQRGETYYLVSWVGYEERTWIRAADIVAGREKLEQRWRRRRQRAQRAR